MNAISNYFKKFFTDVNKDETDYPIFRSFDYNGIPIDIETPAGHYRRGVDKDGKPWEQLMSCDYGRIRSTKGRDEDMIDVFIGPLSNCQSVWCIYQMDPHLNKFDEHKWMVGFDSEVDAVNSYLKHYNSPKFYGGNSEKDFQDFKKMVVTNMKDVAYDSK